MTRQLGGGARGSRLYGWWIGLGALAVAACAGPKAAYVLHIAVSEPGVIRLCKVAGPAAATAAPGAKPGTVPASGALAPKVESPATPATPAAAPPTPAPAPAPAAPAPASPATAAPASPVAPGAACPPYTGEPIAGLVAVSVTGVDLASTYTLEKEHSTIGGVGTPGDFFQLVFKNAFQLAGNATSVLEGLGLGAADGEVAKARAVVQERLVGWLGKRDDVSRGLAAAIATTPPPAPAAPAQLFRAYLDATGTKLIVPTSTPRSIGLGASRQQPPPVRVQRWEAGRELAYAKDPADPATRLDLASVVDHVVRYCKADSFGPITGEKDLALTQNLTWRDYLAKHQIDRSGLARALGFTDPAELRSVLTGHEGSKVEQHLGDAGDAVVNGTATDDQRQLVLAYRSATIARYIATCQANLAVVAAAFATSPAGAKDKARLAALAALRPELDAFAKQIDSAGSLFAQYLAPLLVDAAAQLVQGTVSDDTVTFGPFDLEGTDTHVTVKRKDADGEHDLSSFLARGDRSLLGLGFSMGVGFGFSACDRCTSEIAEQTVPHDTGPATRSFVEQKRSMVLEPIVIGQFDLLSWRNVSLGLVLGVALSDVKGRSNALFAGVGARLHDTVHFSMGIEGFTTRDLPGDDHKDERVELKDPQDQLLTGDQVSRAENRYAFIVALTLAKNLF
jgi:hypothetical protein